MVLSVAGQTTTPASAGVTRHIRGKSFVAVWLTTLVFIVFLLASATFFKARMKEQALEHANAIAFMLADRIDSTLAGTERNLAGIAAGIGRADHSPMMAASTFNTSIPDSPIESVILIDPRGGMLASSSAATPANAEPTSADLVELARLGTMTPVHSTARAATDGASALIAQPVFRDGALIGFVVAQVVLRVPETGTASADQTFLRQAKASGQLQSPGQSTEHIYTYKDLPHYPLTLVYGKDVQQMQRIWRVEDALVAVAIIISLLVTSLVSAGIRRRVLLTTQLETVRGHLVEGNQALRAALAASEILAGKDQLTGLWNRRIFDQRLQEAVAHHGRHEGTFSLLMIDIDHFKAVNDLHGHVVGDDVLKCFADVLQERLRQNDVHARWGGEEFSVLVDGANLDNAFRLAEHIRRAVENSVFTGPGNLTVSIGVAEYQSGETADDLLGRADDALYEAKRTGRNRVVASSGVTRGERFFTAIAEPAPLFAREFLPQE